MDFVWADSLADHHNSIGFLGSGSRHMGIRHTDDHYYYRSHNNTPQSHRIHCHLYYQYFLFERI